MPLVSVGPLLFLISASVLASLVSAEANDEMPKELLQHLDSMKQI